MIKQIKKIISLPEFLITAISGFLFLLTQSASTSPLFYWSYVDSTIFRLLGVTLVRGGRLYVTTLDSKGPVLFFIEAFGTWISNGRIGIFLVQYLFLLVTLFSVLLIAKQILNNKFAWIFPVLYLSFYGFAYEGGNLAEEFSLSFIFLSIYLIIYLFENGSLSTQKNKISNKIENLLLFTLGIVGALTFFIRANNAAAIAAALVVLLYFVFKKLPLKRFLVSLGCIVLGFSFVTALIFGYFIANHSFSDMIYGTFVFNYQYSVNHPRIFSSIFFNSFSATAIIICIVSLATAFVHYQNKKDATLPLLAVFVSLFSTAALYVSGYNWLHYLQLLMPSLLIALVMLIGALAEIRGKLSGKTLYLNIGYVAVFVLLCMDFSVTFRYRLQRKYDKQYVHDSIQIIDEIPVAQRNSVYGYGINPVPFIETSVLPSKRLTALQDWMIGQDPVLKNEVYNYFLINPPKWLILSPAYPIQDTFIKEFVAKNYHQVYLNSNYTLDELKGN
jgi:hypothetical protein